MVVKVRLAKAFKRLSAVGFAVVSWGLCGLSPWSGCLRLRRTTRFATMGRSRGFIGEAVLDAMLFENGIGFGIQDGDIGDLAFARTRFWGQGLELFGGGSVPD
jgi:hypothetical protein